MGELTYTDDYCVTIMVNKATQERFKNTLCIRCIMYLGVEFNLMFFVVVVVFQSDDDKRCLICHDDMCKSAGGVQELHCTHHFHKEVRQLTHKPNPLHDSSPQSHHVRYQIPGA